MLCRHAALCPSDGNAGGQISIFDTGTIHPDGKEAFGVYTDFSVTAIVFFDWPGSVSQLCGFEDFILIRRALNRHIYIYAVAVVGNSLWGDYAFFQNAKSCLIA